MPGRKPHESNTGLSLLSQECYAVWRTGAKRREGLSGPWM